MSNKGLGRAIVHYGTPVNGTNAVQTISVTGSPTGGTFRLEFMGHITAPIAHDADETAIEAALVALLSIGASGVSVADSSGDKVVTFGGMLAKLAVPLITLHLNSLTGGTSPDVTIADTTPGVTATHREAPTGALLQDTENANVYKNVGVPPEPQWTLV